MRLAMLLLRLLQCLFSSTSPLDVNQNCEASGLEEGGLGGCKLGRYLSVAGGLFASFPEYILKWRLESAKHRDFPHGFQLFWKLQQLLGL